MNVGSDYIKKIQENEITSSRYFNFQLQPGLEKTHKRSKLFN